MIWPIDLIVLVLLIVSAVAAINVKDLLSAAVLLGAYSFLACLLWTVMGAVDVAFTEATVGAGVSTVFCVSAIFSHNTKDKRLVFYNFMASCLTALKMKSLINIALYKDSHITDTSGAKYWFPVITKSESRMIHGYFKSLSHKNKD